METLLDKTLCTWFHCPWGWANSRFVILKSGVPLTQWHKITPIIVRFTFAADGRRTVCTLRVKFKFPGKILHHKSAAGWSSGSSWLCLRPDNRKQFSWKVLWSIVSWWGLTGGLFNTTIKRKQENKTVWRLVIWCIDEPGNNPAVNVTADQATT